MDEEIVRLVTEIVTSQLKNQDLIEAKESKVPIGISARHIHLTREHLDILFGQGYELNKKKDLMGGQFAAEEVITIVGSKLSTIEKVRILGPLRSKTQVEISKTDAVKLGLNVPVRESGNIKNSQPITIVGPKGSITLKEGCIAAKRHIHMSPKDAELFNVKDGDIVSAKVSGERGGILYNVQIRVDKTFSLEMHIDTDEANGLGIKCGSLVEIA